MLLRLALLLSLAISPTLRAADTVIAGRAVSNQPMDYVPFDCPPDYVCLDSWFKWVIDVDKVLAGPPVSGRIITARMQHQTMRPAYQKQLRLFVVRSIDDPKQRSLLRADYYLLDMSQWRQMHCLYQDPRELGLSVDEVFQGGPDDSKQFCFELQGEKR
jgi:hypothetical protein